MAVYDISREVITARIEASEEAKKKLGWVREMYAYSLAAYIHKIPHIHEEGRESLLIAQPPADASIYKASCYHYTWGTQFKDKSGTQRVLHLASCPAVYLRMCVLVCLRC